MKRNHENRGEHYENQEDTIETAGPSSKKSCSLSSDAFTAPSTSRDSSSDSPSLSSTSSSQIKRRQSSPRCPPMRFYNGEMTRVNPLLQYYFFFKTSDFC